MRGRSAKSAHLACSSVPVGRTHAPRLFGRDLVCMRNAVRAGVVADLRDMDDLVATRKLSSIQACTPKVEAPLPLRTGSCAAALIASLAIASAKRQSACRSCFHGFSQCVTLRVSAPLLWYNHVLMQRSCWHVRIPIRVA